MSQPSSVNRYCCSSGSSGAAAGATTNVTLRITVTFSSDTMTAYKQGFKIIRWSDGTTMFNSADLSGMFDVRGSFCYLFQRGAV